MKINGLPFRRFRFLARALVVVGLFSLSLQSFACHRSSLGPTSISWSSTTQEYVISVRLDVGSGRTGALLGADGDTRTIAFGFYKACTTLTVNSYSPNQITGAFTGCTMPGANIGPQGAPFNTQSTVMYFDPGYYGFGSCVTQPFACISTTALCGNVATHSYNFTFRTNIMPDSIRVFGVEGAGNPIGGCYPQADLLLTWSEPPSAPMPFNCLPLQQVPAGPGCLGVMPDFRPQAPLPPNCNGSNYNILTQVPAPGSVVGGLGSNLTVSFYSPNGNVMALTCTFQATVADLSPPTVICPANMMIPMGPGCSATMTNLLAMGSTTDHCDPNPSMIQIPAPGAIFSGTSTVRFVSTDASGNSASCSFLVTAADQQPPTLTCPPTQIVSLGSQCQYSLTNMASLANAADNCTAIPAITQSPPQGTIFTVSGTQTITLTAADASGNTSTCAMTLQVNQLPPQIVCPGGSAIPLSSNCDAFLPDFTGSATFANLCQPVPLTLSQVPLPGQQLIGVGPTAVMLVSTDTSGAQSNCSFTVTAVDNAPPSLTCPGPQTLALDANCQANLPAYATVAAVSDNCTASPGIVQSPAAGSILVGGGTTTVGLTATDASGNTSTCVFTVIRQENIPPSLQCPANQTYYLDANCQVSLPNFESVTYVTDNCTANPILSQNPAPGTVFSGIGTGSVTMTATDSAGNVSSCSFLVERVDATLPSITCPPSVVSTPTFVTCQMPIFWGAASANDNCSVSISASHQSGDIFAVGTTMVTYTATDPSGNTASCAFTVQVNPPSLSGTTTASPAIPCLGDSVTLTAISGAAQYLWSNGATSPSIFVNTGGWYWVDILLGPGCVTRDSVWLAFAPDPQPMVFQSGNQACTGAFATYQWYLNGQLLAGENGSCTILAQSGTYSVSVTDSNGCGAVSSGLVLVGGEEPNATQFSIYPNPADHTLIVNVPFLPTESIELELFDLAGRRLFELGLEPRAGDHKVELSAVPSGHYFARLKHGLSFQTIRIVVLHEMK